MGARSTERSALTASGEVLQGSDDLVDVGYVVGVVGIPPIGDRSVGVDDEHRSFRQTGVPLPDVVANTVGLARLASPVAQQREVDPQPVGERHLGEGRGDRDGDDLGAQLPDAGRLCPELGQLVTSDVAEVEDVEDDGDRPALEEVGQGDALAEGAPQVEERSGGADGEG